MMTFDLFAFLQLITRRNILQASHGLWGSAGLKMSTPTLFRQAILTHKVGQTGVVFGVRWGYNLVDMCTHDFKYMSYKFCSLPDILMFTF